MRQIFAILMMMVCGLVSAQTEKKWVKGSDPLTHPLTHRIYLSGVDAEHTKTWDFYCSGGQRSGKWSKIEVPSCWELQGYGEYTYGRFYKTKGLKASDETGRYRTTFVVQRKVIGDRLELIDKGEKVIGDRLEAIDNCYRLVFEGVMTDAQVWIDGKQVGKVHQGGFVEFSYDVTEFIVPGKKQTLEVLVNKESKNKSVNSAERRADWWLFGGIYRPVYIEVLPKEYIETVCVDARENGDLFAKLRIKNEELRFSNGGSDIKLTLDGKEIPYDEKAGCYHCGKVSTWDPEHPNLHTAMFSLGENGHSITQKVGFRTVEFRPHDGIYLNGVRLVVKGTNRHCFWPETGRAMSHEMNLKDAKIIKGMNMNAVRSHYAPDRDFLDICDSIGLLYLDEFTGWQTKYDDSTAVKLLPEFVLRDENHPCIFLWSNGNEGGWNTTVDTLFAKYDIQKRHVVHPWSDFDGIDTHHYPAYQTGAYRLQNGQNVFMPTEFLHSKYDKGAGAGLEDFWDHWTKSPLFAGGFLWAYVDEAVRRTDMPTGKSKGKTFGQKGFNIKDCILDSDGGNGPDGCMDPYRQEEGSVSTIREVWSPVAPQPPKGEAIQSDGSREYKFLVENKYLFSNLRECRMKFCVKKVRGDRLEVIEEGNVKLPELEPGEKGWAKFTINGERLTMDDCYVMELVASRDGEEVCRWTAPLPPKGAAIQNESNGLQRASTPPSGAGGLSVAFNEDGTIKEMKCGMKVVPLKDGPLPVGMLADCYKHTSRVENDGTEVNTFFYKGGVDSIEWRLTPDGELYMDALILDDERGHGYQGQFITEEGGWQLGLTFSYPESEVDSVKWFGRGPYRVWRNRLKGQQYGIWSLAYNNTVTGQYNSAQPPVYPEFKGYRADVKWMKIGDLKVTCETPGMYVRLFTPEEAVDQTPGEMGGLQEGKVKSERTMINFPKGDISFLLSIPPMRSYKPLEQLGPSAQADNIRIKAGDEGFRIKLKFEKRL